MSQPTPSTTHSRPSPALILFIAFMTFGIAAAGFVFSNSQSGGVPPTPEPVTPIPAKAVADAPMIDFSLTSLDGKTVRLSDYQGRIVFLNFWATWCVPCQKELPAFQAFQQEQAPNGAVILAVNLLETADKITPFLDGLGVSGLNVLLDSEGTVSDSYGIFNLPVTFVIDQQGIVRYPKYGPMTVADLQSYVQAVQAG
jgi:peroxiredoxin